MNQLFEKAEWIWRAGKNGVDEFCDFVADFTADPETDVSYTLTIAADSNYSVWLNGKFCAFGQYADYPSYKVCDTVDVTKFVGPGKNHFVIVAWYYGIDTQTYQKGEAGLIFEIKNGAGAVLTQSDGNTVSRLSKDYISGRGELISAQLGPTYHYDMNGYDGFIENPDTCTEACGFAPSRTVPGISKDFHPRPNKKLVLLDRERSTVCGGGLFRYAKKAGNPGERMQYADIAYRFPQQLNIAADKRLDFSVPSVLAADTDGYDGICLIVDLGSECAGFLDLDFETDEACDIDIGFGEHLKDQRCRTSVRGFYAEYRAKKGRNTYLHTFRRFGCRYLQFFFHTNRVTVYYAGLRQTQYPLIAKDFRCGNMLRETVYKVCQNTLLQCLHEHYEDCPWREQALYTMDSRNQMLCGYYAFNETVAPRAALELISHGVRPDGLLMLCYPAGLDFPIPSFSCMYFVQMWEYIQHAGDTSLAREHFGMLTSLMQVFLDKRNGDGVVENFFGEFDGRNPYWNFYEWTPTMSGAFGETQRRLEAPLNAFVSLALDALAKICDAIGEPDKANEYRLAADGINRAIAETFFNPETGLFESFDAIHRGTYTVLTQSLCMLCGAGQYVPTVSTVLRVMETNGKSDVGVPVFPNTLSMNAFRFDALLAIDKEKYAPVILDEIDRDYLFMLRDGATSFWETIVGASDFGDAGSLCHGWSALPVYYYELLTEHN